MMGGRSLRYTAVVYGSACQYGSGMGEDHSDLEDAMGEEWRALVSKAPQTFDDVGGVRAWQDMLKAMPRIQ